MKANNNLIYGVVNNEGVHIDISRSLTYTKRYATIHGYTQISRRPNFGYGVFIEYEKINSKWVNVDQPL